MSQQLCALINHCLICLRGFDRNYFVYVVLTGLYVMLKNLPIMLLSNEAYYAQNYAFNIMIMLSKMLLDYCIFLATL